MRLGLGGLVLLFILSLIFKQNFFALLGGGGAPSIGSTVSGPPNTAKDEAEKPLVQFVSFVLDDTQKTWEQLLPEQAGVPYRHAKLVLFRDYTQSGCGGAESATGPFYCPGDEKVYIDLGFYDELKQRFGAPGEFAQAYVLAHEIGHHVQKLTGVERQVRQLQQSSPQSGNRLSVMMELQADCLAGVWAHSTQQRGLLERADVESALGAAAAVGDDHIQKMTRGRVQPETFTHGSSEQRMHWFTQGLNSGSIAGCNTFAQ
jgi:predicted metalloprotease